jgi:hypothetical protein
MNIIKCRAFIRREFQITHALDLRGVASDNILTMDFNPLIICWV